MTTSAAAPTQTFVAKSPVDVLAAVPVVLGFVPEQSVVMLTFGGDHPFHGRLDLPLSAADRRSAAEMLLRPALRHGVRRVLFVVYSGDATPARSCARALVRRFARAGIEVVHVLRSDGRRWFEVPLDGSEVEGPGTPYDLSSHLFTARAVAAGRVTRVSRSELAGTVAVDPDAMAAVEEAAHGLAGGVRGVDLSDLEDEVAAGRVMVQRWAGGLGAPDPEAVARFLTVLREAGARDAVLSAVDRQEAGRQLAVWSALVRSAPAGLVAPVASVLGFLAWLAGDGALAWCALERAAEGDPPCSLAGTVARALEQALPPAVWEQR